MATSAFLRAARAGEFLLGALFLSAAALKLANVPLFASQIQSYEVITNPKSIQLIAEVLVPLEAALGVAMLAGLRLRAWVLYLAMAMLVFFSALVAYAWPENCGCFGPIKLGPPETLFKNLFMFLLAVPGLILFRKGSSSESEFGVPEKVLIVLLLGGLTLYFSHDELYNNEKYFKSSKQILSGPNKETSPPTPKETTPQAATTPTSVTATEPNTSEASAEFVDAPTGSEVYPADAEAVFKGYTVPGQDGKPLDLGAGTYLVAILNATCEHCMHTVPAINNLAVRPDVPTVVALVQEPEANSLAEFIQQTGASFPMLGMGNDFIKFSAFVKSKPPRFTLERDGKPLKSWEDFPPTAEELNASLPK